MFLPAEIIKKKRNGEELSSEEIQKFIEKLVAGELPDYQMTALLMAIYFQGLNPAETLALTQSMLHSGIVMDFSKVPGFKVDKHSTGGVGDKTSLILGPIVAAAGLKVPMISGRGLGHTGGTLDKLESVPGFNTQLSIDDFQKNIQKHGICFIGQTSQICPADKKIYALRDVTATVESLPLICASIMSKKLAEGIDGLVLDVKFGNGAFMKSFDQAQQLARRLMEIAEGAGKKVTSLLTNMNQPLGRFAGNSLEVFECLEIMKGQSYKGPSGDDLYEDTRELSLVLSAHMMNLSGQWESYQACYDLAKEILESGKALKMFYQLMDLHGAKIQELPTPKHHHPILANQTGYIHSLQTEKIGIAGIHLKAGRAVSTDPIEPTAGIEFHVKIGDFIEKGQPVFTLHGANPQLFPMVQEHLLTCVQIAREKIEKPHLIQKTLLHSEAL
jgi:pyrimidine-nucleoside phosphorylase